MRIPKSVIIAVLISAILRITILTQVTGVDYQAYQELTIINQIAETGIPQTQDPILWGGSETGIQVLYHYLAAFITLILPTPHAALLLTNLAALSIPILAYALAREVSTNQTSASIIALASAFAPLLYQETVLNTTPITLAIPLLLGAYYYFLRLTKTPRDQYIFLILASALALTHPISLVLPAAMVITLLLKKIQAIPLNKATSEVTIFTTFFTVWANLLLNSNILQLNQISALIQEPIRISIGQALTNTGLLVVFAAAYATSRYLYQEKNPEAHTIISLAIVTLALTITQVLSLYVGLLLLSIALMPLCVGAIESYQKSKYTSRTPWAYTIVAGIFVIIFLVTNATTSVALGYTDINNTPTQEEQQLVQEIRDQVNQPTLWNQKRGDLLRYNNIPSIISSNSLISSNSQQIKNSLTRLEQANNPVRYIQVLNDLGVSVIILNQGHDAPITQRCFQEIPTTTTYEVYRVICEITQQ